MSNKRKGLMVVVTRTYAERDGPTDEYRDEWSRSGEEDGFAHLLVDDNNEVEVTLLVVHGHGELSAKQPEPKAIAGKICELQQALAPGEYESVGVFSHGLSRESRKEVRTILAETLPISQVAPYGSRGVRLATLDLVSKVRARELSVGDRNRVADEIDKLLDSPLHWGDRLREVGERLLRLHMDLAVIAHTRGQQTRENKDHRERAAASISEVTALLKSSLSQQVLDRLTLRGQERAIQFVSSRLPLDDLGTIRLREFWERMRTNDEILGDFTDVTAESLGAIEQDLQHIARAVDLVSVRMAQA